MNRPRRDMLDPEGGAQAERVPWVRPIFEVDDALLADMRVALETGRATNDGPHVRELERRFARYLAVADCVAVASGSDALFVAVSALGLEGAKAVLPSFTFISTLNAIVHGGMTPVFCDIDPDTWTLSATHLARLLRDDPEIRLIVPVNVFGVPPDLRAIEVAMRGTGAVLLLDNAHGAGSAQDGIRCAPEPAFQTFSFHATKILPAAEGGAVVSRDPALLAEARRLRNHGFARDLRESTPGYNAKLSELHAAIGIRSLAHLDAAIARRTGYADRLRGVLASRDCARTFRVQRLPEGVRSNFQNLGVLCSPDAVTIAARLEEEGIETRRYFWPALHDLPDYRGRFSLPATERVAETILCLPLYSRMEPAVLDRIEGALRRVGRRSA